MLSLTVLSQSYLHMESFILFFSYGTQDSFLPGLLPTFVSASKCSSNLCFCFHFLIVIILFINMLWKSSILILFLSPLFCMFLFPVFSDLSISTKSKTACGKLYYSFTNPGTLTYRKPSLKREI